MTEAKNDITLDGTQFLYEAPEALHSAVHADLRFRRDGAPLANVGEVTLIPLLVGEFPQAMMHYPIVFAGPEKAPLAVMGLSNSGNLFVRDGLFEDGAYVPAYLRRYPFTLAGAGEEQFVVCIDRQAKGFVNEGDGEMLFSDGEPTEFTKHAIAFLNEYEAERKRTQTFVEMLDRADLFEVKHTLFVDGATGEQENVAEYFAVSEEKMHELLEGELADYVKSGSMAAIHAHLFSLQRWDGLIGRRAKAASNTTEQPETVDSEELVDA